ncbi:hypothetical protein GE061_011476 [Apolygus lucorum]|uniref:Uncharacterized protein n=1 Tax=Apolygus lucorum TaxID=248454 RepID=A0A6A4K212_APOLU|nr:hypothetical protein GE061_011476 [Apolygus lucorum]
MKFFVILVALYCGSYSGGVEHHRTRRIVYGKPLPSSTAYDSTGYFVRLDAAVHLSWLYRYFVHAKLGKRLCGGAALTPHVVQTSCHCIIDSWSGLVPWGDNVFRFPLVKNGWEDMIILHHGHQTEEQMTDGVWSRKFLVHEECKQANKSKSISHDYGWVLTREELKQSNNPHVKYSFAPLFTQRDLVKQYYRNMKYEAICLFIGFGSYYLTQKRPENVYGSEPPSIIQHGWRSLQNYWQCYSKTFEYLVYSYGRRFKGQVGEYNYNRDATWACTTYFGKERTNIAPGDSGGPVMCGGVYFALVQAIHGDLGNTINSSWEHIGLLVFSAYENSAEYREAMEARLWQYWGTDDLPPPVLDRATINPFNPKGHYRTRTTKQP